MCHDRYCATVYGLHLAGLGWRWRPLCHGKVDSSFLSSDSSTSGLQTYGHESNLIHRKHKQGLPSPPNSLEMSTDPALCPTENQYRLSCLFLRQATKPARPSISINRILSTESGHPPAKGRAELDGRNSSACDTAADSFPPLKLPL